MYMGQGEYDKAIQAFFQASFVYLYIQLFIELYMYTKKTGLRILHLIPPPTKSPKPHTSTPPTPTPPNTPNKTELQNPPPTQNTQQHQSFKSYDEAGDPRRLTLLKYLVLASMLHESTIDPFDSQVSGLRT